MRLNVVMILLLFTAMTVDCYALTISDAWQEVDSGNYEKAEEILSNILLETPDSVDELFLLARVYAWNKKYSQAEKYLSLLVTRYPRNVDYILARAKNFYWQNKYSESLKLIEKGKILAPTYNEIVILEESVLAAKENNVMRHEIKNRSESEKWLTSIEYEYESLDNNMPDWKNYFIATSRLFNDTHRFGFNLERIERFGLIDQQMTVNAALRINDSLLSSSSYSMSEFSEFIPKWLFDSSLDFIVHRGLSVKPRIKYSEYTSLNALMFSGSIDKYFSNVEITYVAYVTYTDLKTPVSSHEIKFYYHYGVGKFISIAANVGKELLVTTAIDPIYQDVYGVRMSGKHSLTDYFGLTYQISFHQQGDSYSKQGVRLGVFVKY